MSQYTPFGDIEKFPELKRKITQREYKKVLDTAFDLGIENIFVQKRTSADTCFIPEWDY
jgi:putative pyruvate formate lyase activating enzyme